MRAHLCSLISRPLPRAPLRRSSSGSDDPLLNLKASISKMSDMLDQIEKKLEEKESKMNISGDEEIPPKKDSAKPIKKLKKAVTTKKKLVAKPKKTAEIPKASSWESILGEQTTRETKEDDATEKREPKATTKPRSPQGVDAASKESAARWERLLRERVPSPRRRAPYEFATLVEEAELLSYADRPKFSVASWNIMSDAHFDGVGLGHLKSLPREQRALLVLDDARALRCDLLALQEVERDVFDGLLAPQLLRDGFGSLLHERGHLSPYEQREWRTQRADGCALFWRRDKFELLASERVECRQGIHEVGQGKFGLGDAAFLRQLMFYSNIGSLALLRHRESGHVLALANTHLYSNQLRSSIQLAQLHVVLHRLHALALSARSQHRVEPAALLCGDLNAVPSSPIVKYVLGGRVAADDKALQYNGQRVARRDLAHSLGLSSAYATLEEARQVDHIFASTAHVRTLAALKRPPSRSLIKSGVASESMPSDHVPIMAHFAFHQDTPTAVKETADTRIVTGGIERRETSRTSAEEPTRSAGLEARHPRRKPRQERPGKTKEPLEEF